MIKFLNQHVPKGICYRIFSTVQICSISLLSSRIFKQASLTVACWVHFRLQKPCVSVQCSCMPSKAFCTAFADSLAKSLVLCLRLGRVFWQATMQLVCMLLNTSLHSFTASGLTSSAPHSWFQLNEKWWPERCPFWAHQWHRVSYKSWLSAVWFLWFTSHWVCPHPPGYWCLCERILKTWQKSRLLLSGLSLSVLLLIPLQHAAITDKAILPYMLYLYSKS